MNPKVISSINTLIRLTQQKITLLQDMRYALLVEAEGRLPQMTVYEHNHLKQYADPTSPLNVKGKVFSPDYVKYVILKED